MRLKSLLFACAFAAAAPAFAADTKATAATSEHDLAPQVSLDEMKQLVAAKSATIIDANGTDMYAEGHIPGAVSFAKLEGKLASALPADKNALVVAYCGGTMCSAWEAAAKEAKAAGYTNIKHFKEGIKGWKAAGQTVEKGAQKAS